MLRWIAIFTSALQLCACGGGSSGPSGPTPLTLSYTTPPAFTVGTAIAPLSPTVSGTVTSYSVSPALPAGLALDTTSGVISGTPTAVAAKAGYTVTATNSGGSANATVTLAVNAGAPAISYPSLFFTLTVNQPANIAPTSSGGAAVSWSVSPALPAGLTLDTSTGSITGTPTTPTVAAIYVVTAQNSGGEYKLGLSIQVVSEVVLDLGHATGITTILFNGSRVLSEDDAVTIDETWVARCNLWNSTSDTLIGAFQCAGQIALAGPTVVLSSPKGLANGLQVISSSTGQLQAAITTPYSWWQLAADGSYIAIGNSSGLSAFSPTGKVLFSETGDYSSARVFAAPGEILIALGAKGASAIETVSLAGGMSSIEPAFQGTFNEWFADGSHFQTTTSTTVWTYSSASVQQGLVSLPTAMGLNGEGNYFWTVTTQGGLSIYSVGGNATPVFTGNVGVDGAPFVSGSTLAFDSPGTSQVNIVDLSGASPVEHTYTLPSVVGFSAYAATSATDWYVGGAVLYDGKSVGAAPKYLTLGAALSIAGGGGLVAVATASGQILVVNPQTDAVVTTIPFLSDDIQMSSDGTVLVAQAPGGYTPQPPDESLEAFSLPAGTLINKWTQPLSYTLAPTGTLIGQLTGSTWQVTAVTGGPILWSDSVTGPFPLRFSPDGTLIAVATGLQAPGTGTNIYQNFALTTAVQGWPVGWISNSELLTNTYISSPHDFPLGAYSSATIYSSTGTVLSTPMLPELINLVPIDPTQIYAPSRNSIYSLTNGALLFGNGALFTYPNLGGTVVGSQVVFATNSLLVADTY